MVDIVSLSLQRVQSSLSSNTFLPQSKILIDLEGVCVEYKGHEALRNVSFTLTQGDVIFITGVSGAGKTTLLNILSGDLTASRGRQTFRQGLFSAQVFQDLRLFDNDTVLQNLEMAYDSDIFRTKKEFLKEMDELSHILGLKKNLSSKVLNISGGARQKVALARALLSRPDVLLADEPTSALDFDNTKRIYDLLNIYNQKRGLTVVWASHHRELVKKFNGKIVHLDKGLVVHTGHACFI